jgi:restriction system protein
VIEYIEPVHRGASLVLTELGRTADLTHFPSAEQQAKMTAYWENKKQRRAQKQVEVASDDTVDPVDDDDITDWRIQLLQQLKQFSPAKFESFARMLVSQMGVTIDKNRGIVQSGDHGIDGYGYFESNEFRTIRVAIQAKRYTDTAVSEPEIDKFKGVMDGFNAEYGIFITTTYFTPKAKAKAVQGNRTVTLVDGQRIADLVAQYELYVQPVQSYTLDDYYFEQD